MPPGWTGSRVALTQPGGDDCGSARLRLPGDALSLLGPGVQVGSTVRVTVSACEGEWKFLCKLAAWPSVAFPDGGNQAGGLPLLDPLVQCPPLRPEATLARLARALQEGGELVVRVSAVQDPILTATSTVVVVPPELRHSPSVPLLLHQTLLYRGCRLNLQGGAGCSVAEVLPKAAGPALYRVVPSTDVRLTVAGEEGPLPSRRGGTTAPASSSGRKGGSGASSKGKGSRGKGEGKPADVSAGEVGAADNTMPALAAGAADGLAEGLAAVSLDGEGAARRGPPADGKLGGMDNVLAALRELIEWPSRFRAQAAHLGVRWPRGVLLQGPSGTGKTSAVTALARECGAELHTVTAAAVFGAFQGESERRLREAFAAAEAAAAEGKTVVVLLDEVDALAPRRSKGRAHEGRVVAQLLTLLDGAAAGRATAAGDAASPGHLLVVGTTNRPNALDPAIRRPGRLDREIAVGMPSHAQRIAILAAHTAVMPLGSDVDMAALAALCHGFTGADLAALCREAAVAALTAGLAAGTAMPASPDPASPPSVNMEHFAAARLTVKASVVRGAEVDGGTVRWDDIGGLVDVKKRLRQAVEWPLQHSDAFARLGLTPPRGILLHGPPGCCKTTLARAAASNSGATLIPLAGAQLYSMYVGEGESLLRDTFKRARQAAPSIILLDEIDAIAGKRSEGAAGAAESGGAGVRLLSAILTEMDGLESAGGVTVVGATNRPGALDAALCRPGRFDVLLFVPPPDEEGRLQTLRIHTRGMPLHGDVDLPGVARACEFYTGAELAAVCREAALAALREDIQAAACITARHFRAAQTMVKPALTAEKLAQFAAWGRGSK